MHFLQERRWDALGIGDTTLENDLAEAESPQTHDGFSDHRNGRGHHDHPPRPRTACQAAAPGIVVGVHGHHADNARIAPSGQDQSNGATNGNPAQRHIAKIKASRNLSTESAKKSAS